MSVDLRVLKRDECTATQRVYTLATAGTTRALEETVFTERVTRSSRWWTPSLMARSKMDRGTLRPRTGP